VLYSIIIILLSLSSSSDGNQRGGAAVVGIAITAKTMSNIAWFIMWVQAIEVSVHALCPKNPSVSRGQPARYIRYIFGNATEYNGFSSRHRLI
jgi:hypothetical protein